MIIAQFAVNDTISLGVLILSGAIAFGAVVRLFYGARYKTAYEAASAAARENREALRDAQEQSERITRRLEDSLHELSDARDAIRRFEALPNLERVLALMSTSLDRADIRANERTNSSMKELTERLDRHEKLLRTHEDRAVARHEHVLAIANGMIERLEATATVVNEVKNLHEAA